MTSSVARRAFFHTLFRGDDRGRAWGCAAAVGLAGLLFAFQASAQQPPDGWTQKTGKELAAECHASEPAKRPACIGYVTGIYDLQFAPTPPQGVCPPPNLNPENLTAVVTAYIDTHEDGPAPAAIAQSIVRFFPCASQEQRRR